MRLFFHAPMKPPDDPTPSGDRRVARLFREAFGRAGIEVAEPCGLRTWDAGDPVRQARLARLGHRMAAAILRRVASGRLPRPDLWFTYHLYHKAPDHLGPAVAGALAIPYVVAEASHAPKQAKGRWASGFEAAEQAIRQASRIYALNPVDRACLEPLTGAGVLKDLPPFLDTAPYRASRPHEVAKAELCTRCGLDPSRPLLLTVAMMRADQKLASYRVLAEALDRLAGGDWQLLVAGSGPAEAEVRALLAPFGRRVRLAGLQSGADLLAAYAGADLFVWPSVKEAFGLAFLEAAASGLPVVAGASGGIRHIVAHGETGLVVPAGDAPALAAAIGGLLADAPMRRRFGIAAAERARSVNDIEAAAAMLQADLGALVSRHRELAPR